MSYIEDICCWDPLFSTCLQTRGTFCKVMVFSYVFFPSSWLLKLTFLYLLPCCCIFVSAQVKLLKQIPDYSIVTPSLVRRMQVSGCHEVLEDRELWISLTLSSQGLVSVSEQWSDWTQMVLPAVSDEVRVFSWQSSHGRHSQWSTTLRSFFHLFF